DITSIDDVKQSIENQDYIIHLASETGTGQSMYEIHKYNEVNASGTAILMNVLVNESHQIKKIILASSRAVYGEGKYRNSHSEIFFPEQRNVVKMQQGFFDFQDANGEVLQAIATDEKSKINPVSVYGITKFYQEQLVKTVGLSIHIPFVILRYQNVFGAGQSLRNPYTGILSVFSNQILSGKPINVFEDGKPIRDFVYIDDVVDATIAGLEREEANNEIVNIGSGIPTSVSDVAHILMEKYNKQTEINISGNFRVGDIRNNFADIYKAEKILNFQPKIPFADGIARFVKWVGEQNVQDNCLENSLQEMRQKGLLK
ncbi:MAG: NAD-dependent epimerase/dehydratase family protein, partial [Cruoricaptor ignavus]|nr:NAD-dependent epimerase/dehydratase family protein [Cruoricaptor ignavus]